MGNRAPADGLCLDRSDGFQLGLGSLPQNGAHSRRLLTRGAAERHWKLPTGLKERKLTDHKIGTREEWLAARERLLVREKEHTRLGDEPARQRRELPWVRAEKEYRFHTDDGE